MDGFAAVGASLGLAVAARGRPLAGSALYAGFLLWFVAALVRSPTRRLLLPFSFGSYPLVLAATTLLIVATRQFAWVAVAVLYYACVLLVQRKVRYVPWGLGAGSVDATERPLAYWSIVGICLALAAVMLAALFVWAATGRL
jgi:hypothetical protein